MKSKTLSTYLVGAVAGLTLAAGSVAFAKNSDHHNNNRGGMGQQTTQQVSERGVQDRGTSQVLSDTEHGHSGVQHEVSEQLNTNSHDSSGHSHQDDDS